MKQISGNRSEAARIETALMWMVRELRTQGGFIPVIKRQHRVLAAHMLHLKAERNGWRVDKPFEAYMEAHGLDPASCRIVDYERFYAALEAHGIQLNGKGASYTRAKRRAHNRARKAQAIDGTGS